MQLYSQRDDGTWASERAFSPATSLLSLDRSPSGHIVVTYVDTTLTVAAFVPGSGWTSAFTVPGTSGNAITAGSAVARPDGSIVVCWKDMATSGTTVTQKLYCSQRGSGGVWDSTPLTALATASFDSLFMTWSGIDGPYLSVSSNGVVSLAYLPYVGTVGIPSTGSVQYRERSGSDPAMGSAVTLASSVRQSSLRLANDAAGTRVVAYVPAVDPAITVRTAPAGQPFGAASSIGSVVPDVIGNPMQFDLKAFGDGTIGALWQDDSSAHLQAAVRPNGGASAFGPAAQLRPAVADTSTSAARWITDTSTGNAYAAWLARDPGPTKDRLQLVPWDVGAPTASFAFVPSVALAGAAFSAQATATDAFDPSPALSWDFGDGTTGAGASVTHAYAAPGTYVVTVRAADSSGNQSAPVTQQVTVRGTPVPVEVPVKLPLLTTAKGKLRMTRAGAKLRVTTTQLVSCPKGGAACTAKVVLTAPPAKKRGKRVVLATATITAKAGTSSPIVVVLSKPGTALLVKKRTIAARLDATLRAGSTPVATYQVALALKSPAAKR